MSGFVKAGFSFLKNLGKGQKTTGTETIKNVSISPNLKKFEEQKDQIIKTTDKYTKGLKTQEGKTNVRKFVGPALGRVSKLTQKFPKDVPTNIKKRNKKSEEIFKASQGRKFNKGGRVGLKRGTNLGMQSVKYGLDNKPEITKLDRIAKFIAKDKKKKNKTPMDKAVRKDKKKKRFV